MDSSGLFLRQLRRQLLAFVLSSSRRLNLSPIVKYTALTFFADRFLPSLERYKLDSRARNWLLQPLTESNLQLFVLVSVWIASKIHDTRHLSVKSLKTFADDIIQDQHFTTRDIVDAVLRFDIGAMNITVIFLEELLSQFKEVAKAGDIMSISSCMDIMDLLYETEEMSKLYKYPHSLAVSVLVASYVMGVPAQRSEFPLLPWAAYSVGRARGLVLGRQPTTDNAASCFRLSIWECAYGGSNCIKQTVDTEVGPVEEAGFAKRTKSNTRVIDCEVGKGKFQPVRNLYPVVLPRPYPAPRSRLSLLTASMEILGQSVGPVKLTTSYKEEDIAEIVRGILEYVLEPTTKARGFEKAG